MSSIAFLTGLKILEQHKSTLETHLDYVLRDSNAFHLILRNEDYQ